MGEKGKRLGLRGGYSGPDEESWVRVRRTVRAGESIGNGRVGLGWQR